MPATSPPPTLPPCRDSTPPLPHPSAAQRLGSTSRWAQVETIIKTTAPLLRNATTYTMRQRIWLAMAMARQERSAEALTLLGPAVAYLKPRHENHTASLDQRQLFAHALIVETLAQAATDKGRARRAEALATAQGILDTMTDEARQLHASRQVARWLNEERAKER